MDFGFVLVDHDDASTTLMRDEKHSSINDRDADTVVTASPSPSSIPTTLSALHLPPRGNDISTTLSSLKRLTLSPRNRLQSIGHDARLFRQTVASFALPCIANERCGSWYIPPKLKAGSAYFKSTDGHFGQWAFNLRRLNLQILELIGENGGCIIVDSTRRGKSMPDALSKTVPIWCAVLNRLLFEEHKEASELCLPDDVVGPSECEQIAQRLDGFVREARALDLDIERLRSQLQKPLRPRWVTPGWNEVLLGDRNRLCNLVICYTASRRVHGTEDSESGYIQGAGDDSEGWALGLTPALFWQNHQALLAVHDDEYAGLVAKILSESHSDHASDSQLVALGSTGLFIGEQGSLGSSVFDAIISYGAGAGTWDVEHGTTNQRQPVKLHLDIGTGKLGGRALRHELPRILAFVNSVVPNAQDKKICIAGPAAGDISVGIALAICCLCHDDAGHWKSDVDKRHGVTKASIKRRLAQISSAFPAANPSRTTLQSVHSFLMPVDSICKSYTSISLDSM